MRSLKSPRKINWWGFLFTHIGGFITDLIIFQPWPGLLRNLKWSNLKSRRWNISKEVHLTLWFCHKWNAIVCCISLFQSMLKFILPDKTKSTEFSYSIVDFFTFVMRHDHLPTMHQSPQRNVLHIFHCETYLVVWKTDSRLGTIQIVAIKMPVSLSEGLFYSPRLKERLGIIHKVFKDLWKLIHYIHLKNKTDQRSTNNVI